ncbi:hypothetical protein VKT23_006239 [Stygiomarasmius scandens]|uniref:Cep57 centrosome microtubule-binding domain-containing protein n=1 Tax=Marasmiellus scandens TaxID=2682957 RepID=A0ABR1JM79_9AGAR
MSASGLSHSGFLEPLYRQTRARSPTPTFEDEVPLPPRPKTPTEPEKIPHRKGDFEGMRRNTRNYEEYIDELEKYEHEKTTYEELRKAALEKRELLRSVFRRGREVGVQAEDSAIQGNSRMRSDASERIGEAGAGVLRVFVTRQKAMEQNCDEDGSVQIRDESHAGRKRKRRDLDKEDSSSDTEDAEVEVEEQSQNRIDTAGGTSLQATPESPSNQTRRDSANTNAGIPSRRMFVEIPRLADLPRSRSSSNDVRASAPSADTAGSRDSSSNKTWADVCSSIDALTESIKEFTSHTQVQNTSIRQILEHLGESNSNLQEGSISLKSVLQRLDSILERVDLDANVKAEDYDVRKYPL